MRPHSVLVAALAASLLALPPAPPLARAFDVQRHAMLTKQVLVRRGMPAVAASMVGFGATLPDVMDCAPPNCYCDFWFVPRRCQPDSNTAANYAVHHFDNNLLDQSIWALNDQMAIAQGGVSGTPVSAHAAAMSMLAFGRALHTTQDFYAHSTFLEINLPLMRGNPTNLPLWMGQPYTGFPWTSPDGLTGGGGIETGYYLLVGPFGTYDHAWLNKDNAGSSVHGRLRLSISSPSMITTLYGIASGDLANNGQFTDAGLAARHTTFALDVLIHGGWVFPYVFGPGKAPPPRPQDAQRVQAFFDWVAADPEFAQLAEAADSLIAHMDVDSLESFPLDRVDADGVPLPLTAGAPPRSGGLLLGSPHPNPSGGAVRLQFLAPSSGRVSVQVHDVEGRRIATLLDGETNAGLHEVRWSGRDAGGRAVPPGVYVVTFHGFGRRESQRVALTP